MRILHACFSKGPGGIEQAFLNMDNLLRQQGHEIITVIQPNSWLASKVCHCQHVKNCFGNFDLFTVGKLRKLLKDVDVILVHGNRALSLLHCAKGKTPLAVIQHRYRFKHLHKADAAFCITRTMQQEVIAYGIPAPKTAYLPNFLTSRETEATTFQNPPVIGFLGRFVPEKGLEILLEAASLLQKRGVPFSLRLGGNGALETVLKEKAGNLKLNSTEFIGWVERPEEFFKTIDVFCLPSLSESFGLVILEAFAAGCPVVSTRTKGPEELIENDKTGLLVTAGDPVLLADALEKLLKDESLSKQLAANARGALAPFRQEAVGSTLSTLLEKVAAGKQLA